MKDFLQSCIKTRCEVVVDEEYLTKVFNVLNRFVPGAKMNIGNCGWREANKWYVSFKAPQSQVRMIKNAFQKENFSEIMFLTNKNCWVKVEKLI